MKTNLVVDNGRGRRTNQLRLLPHHPSSPIAVGKSGVYMMRIGRVEIMREKSGDDERQCCRTNLGIVC